MSESQERMMAIVSPDKLDEFLALTGKWVSTASSVLVTMPSSWERVLMCLRTWILLLVLRCMV